VDLVLASSSAYRRALLSRLGLRFDTISPDIDETPLSGETPREMAERLSRRKAEAVAPLRPRALIVGSDQVAVLGGRILRKPGGHEANVRQLVLAAGRTVHFLTGVALLNAASGALQCEVVEFRVRLRSLGEKQAEAYVRIERAYDCAGGFRAEGLGVALIEHMEGGDPTSLVGLPLITLVSMLRREGVDPLSGCRPGRP
jgi:MAF protein